MNILIAPDKFKDALDAEAVADALAEGSRATCPEAHVVRCPLGDGGEGTGRLLAKAIGAACRETEVLDPLGRPRAARWWFDQNDRRAIVEMAEASGIWLLQPDQRDALSTASYGTGQLIRAAVDVGCRKITLCVGGSATVDGGAGCLQGLGWRLIDAKGGLISTPMSGGRLTEIARIEPPDNTPSLEIEILCDVTNPLLGPDGAAPVFAPQKGASTEQVHQLEAGLQHWADVLADYGSPDLTNTPGVGAAGGLPFGLISVVGARIVRGIDRVVETLDLREKVAASDIVFTGEGRLDAQTASGKTVAGVVRLAAEFDKPTTAFVGAAPLGDGQSLKSLATSLGLRDIVVVASPGTSLEDALRGTRANLTRAARDYVAGLRGMT